MSLLPSTPFDIHLMACNLKVLSDQLNKITNFESLPAQLGRYRVMVRSCQKSFISNPLALALGPSRGKLIVHNDEWTENNDSSQNEQTFVDLTFSTVRKSRNGKV
jgi:hypothetical protein